MARESVYGICFVDDDILPGGRDFMFVEVDDDGAMIFYRESTIGPKPLEDSWAAYRALGGPNRSAPTTAVPSLRRMV